MKKIFARIGIELVVTDEEANQILKEAGSYFECNHIANNEFDISKEFAKRFVEGGVLTEDSYIPEDCIEEI